MKLYIPVFSERVERSEKGRTYRLRPAFPSMPWREREQYEVYNPREDRALEELTRILRRQFNTFAARMRHDELLRWSFHPDLTGTKIPIQVYLRKQSVTGELFAVTYQSMGRRIVTLPKLPGLAYDVARGERIEDRTNEVLTRFFRKEEKRQNEKLDLDQYLSPGLARLTNIELNIRVRQKFKKPEQHHFALLGGTEKMSGAQELEKVGRCINRLYPQRLHRAILRNEKVEAVKKHFKRESKHPQPLVLLGQSQVGKSAVIHEFLYQRIDSDERPIPEVWLLSPQRIISGMSYVGQWEERAHAIFKEAKKRGHILLFDDLPGLFQAGKSRDSDLTVGHVLKAYFEEGGIRVIAEATPESWRKLREIDRGFSDFFRSLPIEETSQRDTLRILIRTVQELESTERNTYFEPDLIPAVYELQNRFARSQAFPGKAVKVVRQLTQKYSGRELDREDVYSFFQTKTGIQRQFLRQRYALDRTEIERFFVQRIKGQPAAIEAMSDLVSSCLSQTNEPGRPMGALLFLGPTGVGKTECAKCLAEYFFGSAERLLRFDMNEFVGPDAAERLIGSAFRPRGLLTGAVRRQPYSVILLDEIEKAHPRVFDLLLQLLGDGRLTDASGETADFCNCIVVMTSNLGARSARHQLGFANEKRDDSRVYREAAEKFFRPELFNRLDHIVPFGELSREDIESLVALMSEKALSRIGISETQLSLKIQPDVYARLAEMGFKPEFGARALRRSVEEFLVEPIALRISELPKNRPAIVTCSCHGEGGLDFETTDLRATPRSGFITKRIPLGETDFFIDQVNEFLYRIEDELEQWRDESDGTIDPLDPVQMRYFSLRETIMSIRRMRDHYQSAVESEIKRRRDNPDKPAPQKTSDNYRFFDDYDPEEFLVGMYQTTDSNRYINRAVEGAEPLDHLRQIATDIINRANALSLIVSHEPGVDQRCAIDFRGPDDREIMRYWQYPIKTWLSESDMNRAIEYYRKSSGKVVEFKDHYAADFSWEDYWATSFLVAEGPAVYDMLRSLAGTNLLIRDTGKAAFAEMRITPIPDDVMEADLVDWLNTIPKSERFEIVNIQSDESSAMVDLASGYGSFVTEHRIWTLINLHLPMVEELREFVEQF